VIRSNGRHRPVWRAIALALIVAGWGVPFAFPHVAEDDLLCAIADAAAAGEPSRLVGSAQTAPAEHCDVCHSLRSFRHAGLPATIASAVLSSARPLPPEATTSAEGLITRQLPARAPPTAS
jgi:hypothetical protein